MTCATHLLLTNSVLHSRMTYLCLWEQNDMWRKGNAEIKPINNSHYIIKMQKSLQIEE